jgi:hypothetical protein
LAEEEVTLKNISQFKKSIIVSQPLNRGLIKI